MHLKTLTLRGFKSFASATTLHLEPGITCVVGPNGSGKSNVVDALSWVMGEQGAKSLRGGSMSDVIFAGTSSRAPLGRAEVSLTIDNSDGLLPIDYSEVTISRTLFRGGGSEYAINGESCRLLDIQELLSDTGMGREMHVIVGQGQLDAVLSAGPEERRGFIEEAAGVLKHRRRKEKALRKLEAMRANVDRVTDLSTEIRRQLGPLAKQADVARRAQVIQADLRDSRARLLADDLVQLTATLQREVADETALRERRTAVEAAADSARSRLAALEAQAAAAAPLLREATDTWHSLSGLRERLRGLHSLAAERTRLLGAPTQEHRGTDPEELDARAARAREEEQALAAEVETARAARDAVVAERTRLEEAEREAERALAAVHRGVADRREGLARLTGQVAARRSAAEAAQAEIGRLRAGLAEAEERSRHAQAEFTALEQQVAGEEEGEEGLDEAHEEALEELDAAEAALAALLEEERTAEGERRTWQTRRDTLELSLARKDGTGALLEAADRLAGLRGSLPDALSVEHGYETAVAAVLGAHTDAAVVESTDVAVDAIRRARDEDLGQVRLVVAGAPGQDDDGAAPAGGRWARDVVTADGELSGAVATLLAGAVVVDDLAAARAAVAAADVVAVTRDGDVLSRAKAAGGTSAGPSVLELHAAHEEAVAEADAATARAEQARFGLVAARDRVSRAQESVDATLAALHASDARLAGVAEQLGRLGSAARSAEAEAERLRPAIAELVAKGEEHERQLAELLTRLEVAQQEPERTEEDLTAATAERDRAAGEARAARARETEARLALRTVEERAGALSGRAASLERAAEAERVARRKAAEREQRRARQAETAALVRAGAEQALGVVERSLAAAADAREEAEEARGAREREIAQVRGEVEEATAELARLTDAVHRDEVARTEQRLRISQLEERSVSELGLDPEVLVEEYGPHQPVPVVVPEGEEPRDPVPYVREEQDKRRKRAERDLARLGRVNPLALEEHAALAERHRFLTEQLADLKKSRADLMEIVREIDERVERVFAEAYADTAAAFDDVFARLFPGGEGRLVLTDPEDMLTTGIEIEARPAGKKVKRLSLLSGGERSLTAVALLVAIFKARPSPFYVMDEVEAALDDTNLGRLLEIFTELREDSQLIVITHQKRTMEVADALYGVTMRGDGVTTVISQRLVEEERAGV
ncbi:condensin subunit Smc [Georgenia satyanarayanai]|uniref:Chromosome partition protein Smc n=1 Tax=Georgenia satyanarayanai TaxID=860221 RepID=A0A2Y9AHT9_9MICO|nr:chromosome segregation protein SMC [Georgenia satyanarayanai]PYF99934.1 condensin subunit Smc [Georgenia satyanarayanai]SSA41937.1 condensin subunit Smc [Georgenia satyanarayanai]